MIVVLPGEVGELKLARPERANAYDAAHLEALAAGIAALAESRVVIVHSEGRHFCGGADLGDLGARRRAGDWQAALGLRSQAVFTMLARAPFVSIAVVQGGAVAGGFELALACDLRVVGEEAVFSLPETRLGVVPSAGGLSRLARLCGASVASGVILGGQSLDAAAALRLGLAHQRGGLHEARLWASELAQRDPVAQRRAKERLLALDSDASLLMERTAQAGLYRR